MNSDLLDIVEQKFCTGSAVCLPDVFYSAVGIASWRVSDIHYTMSLLTYLRGRCCVRVGILKGFRRVGSDDQYHAVCM